MKFSRHTLFYLFALFSFIPCVLIAAPRTWTDLQGQTAEAEYIRSDDTSVTLQLAGSRQQALRLQLDQLSKADRAYVKKQQAAEREANMVEGSIVGRVIWRLPAWNSLGWSSSQKGEIWLWDQATNKPGRKLCDLTIEYVRDDRYNNFTGTFASKKRLRLPKDGAVVLKAMFTGSVNGESKDMEEFSKPLPVPTPGPDGTLDLTTVRLSLRK